jgi:hypothetical protein
MLVDGDASTLKKNHPRMYCHHDVEVLNLVSDPIWIFDILNKSMWWGNTAALAFWNVQSLEEFTSRNYAEDMSETERQRNMDTLERLKRNEKIRDYVVRPLPKGESLFFGLFFGPARELSLTYHVGMVPI